MKKITTISVRPRTKDRFESILPHGMTYDKALNIISDKVSPSIFDKVPKRRSN